VRVVALSTEPSLAAALNMNSDWEVVYAAEPEQAAHVIAGANVVLIGGGTEEGLRLAEELRSLGVTIPTVVVGDTPTPQGARFPVVTTPFTLHELQTAVERAVAGAKQSAPQAPIGVDAIEMEAPRAPRIETQPPVSPSTDRSGRRGHLEVARDPSEGPTLPAAMRPIPTATPATRAAGTAAAAPAASQTPAAASTPPAAREDPLPAPPVAKPEVAAGARGFLRRRAKAAAPEENQVSTRLRVAFDALSAVESAIDELPVLTDLRGLTQALIGEVIFLLSPETAALYLPSPDGFRVWASHGFSNVEKTMAVQTHQPLFADLLVRHEAVLIEPLDLAYQLAAGIGGARTNAFLASPIEVNRKCVGVIVAGRDHFENEDLDQLEALSEEAAMGLGIALGLDRLRGSLS